MASSQIAARRPSYLLLTDKNGVDLEQKLAHWERFCNLSGPHGRALQYHLLRCAVPAVGAAIPSCLLEMLNKLRVQDR